MAFPKSNFFRLPFGQGRSPTIALIHGSRFHVYCLDQRRALSEVENRKFACHKSIFLNYPPEFIVNSLMAVLMRAVMQLMKGGAWQGKARMEERMGSVWLTNKVKATILATTVTFLVPWFGR